MTAVVFVLPKGCPPPADGQTQLIRRLDQSTVETTVLESWQANDGVWSVRVDVPGGVDREPAAQE